MDLVVASAFAVAERIQRPLAGPIGARLKGARLFRTEVLAGAIAVAKAVIPAGGGVHRRFTNRARIGLASGYVFTGSSGAANLA